MDRGHGNSLDEERRAALRRAKIIETSKKVSMAIEKEKQDIAQREAAMVRSYKTSVRNGSSKKSNGNFRHLYHISEKLT